MRNNGKFLNKEVIRSDECFGNTVVEAELERGATTKAELGQQWLEKGCLQEKT